MSKNQIVLTNKGRRLIATKYGIPYGLFLAYIDKYWLWVILVGSFVTGFMLPLWKALIVDWAVIAPLVYWAKIHFDVGDES